MSVNVGDIAPEFELYDSTKTKRRLSEFLGKGVVVLAFYPGAFTGVCDTEWCALRDSKSEFNSLNAQIVGVSVDGPFALKGFAAKHNIDYPLLADFQRVVTNTYGLLFKSLGGVEGYGTANRAVLVLNSSGKVCYKWEAAPNPGVEPDYDELKTAIAAAV